MTKNRDMDIPQDEVDEAFNNLELLYIRKRQHYLAWERNGPQIATEYDTLKKILVKRAGAKHFGSNSFISTEAGIYTHNFSIGVNSWIAGGVIVRGDVTVGDHSSINPYAHIAGLVRIKNHVRIAGLVSIYGFNHGFERTDVPIYTQPVTTEGVTIQDDVWIGANTLVVDGVTIGAHSVIAGGSVVTQSFPEYSVIAGNPARLLRGRV